MNDSSEAKGDENVDEVVTAVIFSLFGVTGFVGNSLVLFVIAKVDDLRDVTNLFIANQSLIDMTASMLLIASYVAPLPPLPVGRSLVLARFVCAFWYTRFVFWSVIVASSLNLVLMTLERYYAVVFPIHYRSQLNSSRAKAIVPIPWIIGALYQQNLMYFTTVKDGQCLSFLFPNRLYSVSLALTGVILEYALPVVVMVFVHVAIVRKLRHGVGKDIADSASHTQDKPRASANLPKGVDRKFVDRKVVDPRTRARKNVIRTLLLICVCFIICWTPNMVIYVYYLFQETDFQSLIEYRVSVFLAFGNMCINPFIYTFQYRRFRKALMKVFGGKSRKKYSQSNVTTVTDDTGAKSFSVVE